MKKKPVLFLLLAAAILVWGTVAWRIISGISGGNKMVRRVIPTKVLVIEEEGFADSFEIKANYPDPFLGGWPKSNAKSIRKKVKPAKATKKTPEKPKEPEIDWSFIQYKGLIKNKNGKKVGLASVNGQDFIINEGMELQEVLIKKIYEDSVEVLYSKKIKYILSK